MTDSPSHPDPGQPAPLPPPGCPAHPSSASTGPGGLFRIHDSEAQRDLAGLYEKLRAEHGPVAPVLLHNDVPVWAVLGHTENLHMVRTPSHFTRDTRQWRAIQDGTAGPHHPLAPVFSWQPICSFTEGGEHQRLRGAVTAAIASIDHRGVRRFIHRYSQRLVNDFCQDGTADLVTQFAEHLPMMVMCQIIGMPEEYNERMVQAARDMIKGTETAIESNAYVMAALERLVARRRQRPENDFTGALLTHPSQLTDDEVAQHLRLVLIASFEATANLIANVLRVVMTDPRFRAQLNGGQMTVPEAVEQSLWDEPPFSAILTYVAKQDTELGGRRIRAGDGLMLGIAPGNADPVVRPEPGAHMQGNRSHLAFSGGPHECPGQDIGRAIADTGIDALLTRLPDVHLAVPEEELCWTASILSRHLVALPVTFAPKPPQDVMRRPTAGTAGSGGGKDTDWQITSAAPNPAAGPDLPPEVPVPPAAQAPSVTPQPAGTAPRGVWQRLLRWWRGD